MSVDTEHDGSQLYSEQITTSKFVLPPPPKPALTLADIERKGAHCKINEINLPPDPPGLTAYFEPGLPAFSVHIQPKHAENQ